MERHGIIPADAGSTSHGWVYRRDGQDHPRGCGEHPSLPLAQKPEGGSSPRMRGALQASEAGRRPDGIIPADAGSTLPVMIIRAIREDHPRGCGEHSMESSITERNMGSSPRMRGAPDVLSRPGITHRIIPADAGSTGEPVLPSGRLGDHPRGCGEHDMDERGPVFIRGSSPRMRGAPASSWCVHGSIGIIPADAGSTYVWRCC